MVCPEKLILGHCVASLLPSILSGSPRVVPEQAALASLGILLEIQIIRPPTPIVSETLGVGPRNLCFNKPFRRFWWVWQLGTTGLYLGEVQRAPFPIFQQSHIWWKWYTTMIPNLQSKRCGLQFPKYSLKLLTYHVFPSAFLLLPCLHGKLLFTL